ncbi:MAG: UDP-N-acetylenolpyruvoylglucosamine reductase [Sulfuricurvum sp. PD_MW2]|jgi:UDP-N-acetylmuramate dehydrogenase|uniref:UDP-N-acetylmuramate dehydrogenase n=1 Tax=Sulfuricurvum sp. PD_MW2 TaxID=2027917 RepID=UPI000C0665B8|nr:UDP-N-acetylmuramate dehydrogenase [Sulfuricurvum sp. PD_MW2]PHM17757.1 MAG: UDP-N-acetylenolpyruvoylglucosamine reductase [Sulfuricurvum sp. PD_MW2]
MKSKTIDFSKFSSLRIGPIVEVALIENDVVPQGHTIIGAANNILVSPTPPPLMILSKEYDFIALESDGLHIGAATPGGRVVSFCKKHDIAHFEYLSKLPGTLGGMLKMNAGLKEYEIFNHLIAIRTQSGWKKKEEIEHGYRKTSINEVVFEAVFEAKQGYSQDRYEMFNQMRSNQPSDPSAGSCFKNPPNDYAGRLIEAVGLKGLFQGAMSFSNVHANFLVNTGGGTYNDALTLIHEAQSRIKREFDIDLQCEVVIIDKNI